MKLLDDLKSFVSKGNSLAIAIGVVLGVAVSYLIGIIIYSLIDPLFRMITAGNGLEYLLDWKYLKLGTLIMGIIHFAVAIGILYFVFGVLWNCCCGTKDTKDSAPPPPPPAPPTPPAI